MVLRLEDIDDSRIKSDALHEIERDLAWLGLDWDGPKLIQTQRIDAHHTALEKLIKLEAVYPCTCTRGDIARAASAPQQGDGPPRPTSKYPGTCSNRLAGDAQILKAQGVPFTWRFRTPKDGWPGFHDGLHGFTPGAIAAPEGDFIVWRAAKGNQSGGPSYQLAVVVDDAHQGVTEVVRGEDLLDSTPRQISLLRLLDLPIPAYYHVPLVVDPAGRRLAKRSGSISLRRLREYGMEPNELIGKLAQMWGLVTPGNNLSLKTLLPSFDWNKIQKGPWIWS